MISLKRSVLILGLLLVLPSCERAQPAGERAQPAGERAQPAGERAQPASKSSDEAALQALQKSIEWLDANPPDPATANLGSIAMDAWSWALFARLHPSDAVRQRAKQEARKRLGQLEPVIEPTPVAVSYWAVLLDSMGTVGIDTSPYLAALSKIDLSEVVKKMSPTTALWTSGILRSRGIAVEVEPATTTVATDAAGSDWKPTVRSAYAIYHEIAADTDLGRAAPRLFNQRQLDFVRRALPQLLEVCIAEPDTDAAAEVLITAAILDQRERPYYVDGMRWLIAQQRSDGTYFSGRDLKRDRAPENFRHVVAVGSWAVLESLQVPRSL
jgi:hypothetical protein